jgi:uncharacterized membrane-anchored protein
MKRSLLVIGACWMLALGGLIVTKEFTLRTGRTVFLQTVPVDPRDLFRGDYVVLRYPMSALDLGRIPADQQSYQEGQAVYVEVTNDGRYAVASRVTSTRPDATRTFLKGRVTSTRGRTLGVEYGIESYFVPEGKGHRLERLAGHGLEVQVAIDRFGQALIKALLIEGKPVDFRAIRNGV